MLLFIANIDFTYHNCIILYSMYILDSVGILCFCSCILTILTIKIVIRSLQLFLFIDCILYVFLRDGFVFSVFNSRS
jgi:hypothetical protein